MGKQRYSEMKVIPAGYIIKNDNSEFNEQIHVEFETTCDNRQVSVSTNCGGELSLGFEEWEAVKEAVTKLYIQNGDEK